MPTSSKWRHWLLPRTPCGQSNKLASAPVHRRSSNQIVPLPGPNVFTMNGSALQNQRQNFMSILYITRAPARTHETIWNSFNNRIRISTIPWRLLTIWCWEYTSLFALLILIHRLICAVWPSSWTYYQSGNLVYNPTSYVNCQVLGVTLILLIRPKLIFYSTRRDKPDCMFWIDVTIKEELFVAYLLRQNPVIDKTNEVW